MVASKSWCGSRCHHLQSRGPLWGRKQLPPLSLSTIIKLIRPQSRWYSSLYLTAVACRWAGGVTNVSVINVFMCVMRRRLCYFCLTLFGFGSSWGVPQRCWQMASVGGGLAPLCPHNGSQQTEQQAAPGWIFRAHKLCSSSEADLPHTQMDYSPGLQWYHQFGVWGDFSGAN